MKQIRVALQYLVRIMWGVSQLLIDTGRVRADPQAHIGAGVRYNAQKKKVGNYYSTPIYGFRCKCHLCSGWFEIRTDPKVSSTFSG